MGSSAKKKKAKKADFQKPKFKIGKARPKPSNFTNTSFKSKSIGIKKQFLATDAPSAASQISHHLSLLSSKNESQRIDALRFLHAACNPRPPTDPQSRLPLGVLLPKALPLMLDASPSVRSEVLVLLRGLPKEDVEEHIEQLQLFIRAGITHIAVGIRSSSLDMLNWACLFCSDALVSCPGGWFKVLTSLMAMQGWTLEDSSLGWSSSKTSFAKSDSDGKAMVKGLNVLAVFLRVGFQEPSEQSDPGTYGGTYGWPLTDTAAHMISKRSNAFGHLNLFGPPRDEESQEYPDEDERQDIFQQKFRKPLERALTAAKKEAGEYGRAAATVLETISESMKTFDEGERNVGYRTSAHARIPRANR